MHSFIVLISHYLLVVHLCQGPVPFLASGIPYVEFYDVGVKLDILCEKTASDSRVVQLRKLARVVAPADTGLTDSHVPQYYDLVRH